MKRLSIIFLVIDTIYPQIFYKSRLKLAVEFAQKHKKNKTPKFRLYFDAKNIDTAQFGREQWGIIHSENTQILPHF